VTALAPHPPAAAARLPANTSSASEESRLIESIYRIVNALHTDPRFAAGPLPPALRTAIDEAAAAAQTAERRLGEFARRTEQLESLAVTDPLTGLLNRRGFEREMERALATARRYRDIGVLIYVDLDGFKPINDTLGHAAGDEVLKRVAQILVENVRDSDRVARVGGDEFVALLTRTEREGGLARAETLDALINSALVSWGGRMIPVRASFGFQLYGADDDSETLLARADEAMYAVKKLRGDMRRRDRRRA
jgi:diguanylate cyclase (GGDEF)-like protein